MGRGGRRRAARGSDRERFALVGWRAMVAALGPTPVDEAIAQCEAFRTLVAASPAAVASTLNPLALLHAMRGEHDVAGRLLEQARAILQELGGFSAGVSHLEAMTRLLTGHPELAEAPLRADSEALPAMSAGSAREHGRAAGAGGLRPRTDRRGE